MQEFICAYQKIYITASSSSAMARMHDIVQTGKSHQYIRATRYGRDHNNKQIFEIFTHSGDDLDGEKVEIGGLPTDGLPSTNQMGFKDYMRKKVVTRWDGKLSTLNEMIVEDCHRNKTLKCKVLWWVDISVAKVDRATVSDYVVQFGLPNNSKFLSSFGNFGHVLSKDPKSRVFAGNGVTISPKRKVSSLSFFAQAISK